MKKDYIFESAPSCAEVFYEKHTSVWQNGCRENHGGQKTAKILQKEFGYKELKYN
jgi:hypothetical protein